MRRVAVRGIYSVKRQDFGGASSRKLKRVPQAMCMARSWLLGKSCITDFGGVRAPGASGSAIMVDAVALAC